jgi:hypothetical protein
MVLDVHRIDTRPEPGLRRIGCMVGARSGSARPLANAESLDQRLPTSHLVIIDAGHFVWQEAPTEYASIVIDSLTGTAHDPAQWSDGDARPATMNRVTPK